MNWGLERLGLDGVVRRSSTPIIGGPSVIQSYFALFIAFVYLWLPFMILPVEAALERVPRSYLEASSDLGARPWFTFRKIVLPLAKPGLIAGSIFTFFSRWGTSSCRRSSDNRSCSLVRRFSSRSA